MDKSYETGWEKHGETWRPPSTSALAQFDPSELRDLLLPPGMVEAFAGSTPPTGWLLCQGQLVSRQTYRRLFSIIGTTYGAGDGSTTFGIPNLKGRVITGLDAAQTEFDVLGETGGSKTSTSPHTHSLSSHTHAMEGHTHTFSTDYRNTNHAHNVYARDTNHDHAFNHWHLASTSALLWNGTQTHGHHDRGGSAAEGPWEGANWTGGTSVNVDGTAQAGPNGNNITGGMRANWSHDHPSTNYASESPWPGDYNHQHAGTTANPGGWNGGQQPPSNNTSGVSSAEAASGNLVPYMAMNFIIKT